MSLQACTPCGDGSKGELCCTEDNSGLNGKACTEGYLCGAGGRCTQSKGNFQETCSNANQVLCNPDYPGLVCTSLGAPPGTEWCNCVSDKGSAGKACGPRTVCAGDIAPAPMGGGAGPPKAGAPKAGAPKAGAPFGGTTKGCNISTAPPSAQGVCANAANNCPTGEQNFCTTTDASGAVIGCTNATKNVCPPGSNLCPCLA